MNLENQHTDEVYEKYEQWKGWDSFLSTSADQADYFKLECREVHFENADLLEIGFGSGSFLNWAQKQGANIAGSEINPVLIERAQDANVKTVPVDFTEAAASNKGTFDAIFAFDVFEHLSLVQINEALNSAERMLKPGGYLYLRFPNGQSPFGLPPQHGDPTHLMALSKSIFEAILNDRGFEIARYGPAARPKGRGIARRIAFTVRYALRDLIAVILNFTYATQIVWDPVVTLVLRKNK